MEIGEFHSLINSDTVTIRAGHCIPRNMEADQEEARHVGDQASQDDIRGDDV